MFAGGILVLHQAFQGVHQPPPQRLAAIERPIVELQTIAESKARDKFAAIALAGVLEIAWSHARSN